MLRNAFVKLNEIILQKLASYTVFKERYGFQTIATWMKREESRWRSKN